MINTKWHQYFNLNASSLWLFYISFLPCSTTSRLFFSRLNLNRNRMKTKQCFVVDATKTICSRRLKIWQVTENSSARGERVNTRAFVKQISYGKCIILLGVLQPRGSRAKLISRVEHYVLNEWKTKTTGGWLTQFCMCR